MYIFGVVMERCPVVSAGGQTAERECHVSGCACGAVPVTVTAISGTCVDTDEVCDEVKITGSIVPVTIIASGTVN